MNNPSNLKGHANKLRITVVMNPSYLFRQGTSSKDFLSASNLEKISKEAINTGLAINKE